MADRRGVAAVVLAALAVVTAGCSGGDPTLLDGDALPSPVTRSSHGFAGFPSASLCSHLGDQQEFASTDAWAADGYGYWTYRLEDGDGVSAVLLDFRDDTQRELWIGKITDAITTCAADQGANQVTALTGLPDGRFGYGVTEPFNDATKRGSMVFAPAGGSRLVGVAVTRVDGSAPKADVDTLLRAALDAAPDLSDLPSKKDRDD